KIRDRDSTIPSARCGSQGVCGRRLGNDLAVALRENPSAPVRLLIRCSFESENSTKTLASVFVYSLSKLWLAWRLTHVDCLHLLERMRTVDMTSKSKLRMKKAIQHKQ
ncbi:unnamed protein product, partial [Hapterophycus canaliculatus]